MTGEVILPGKENREKLYRKLLDRNLSTAVGVCLPVEFIRGHLKRIDYGEFCAYWWLVFVFEDAVWMFTIVI